MSRVIKFRAWDKESKVMIDANAWYFSEEFEPFIDSVERAQKDFEIMQYTGLHDRNGKEIYESDICRDATEIEAPITWGEGSFWYGIRLLTVAIEDDLEVIGNIYENPELIK